MNQALGGGVRKKCVLSGVLVLVVALIGWRIMARNGRRGDDTGENGKAETAVLPEQVGGSANEVATEHTRQHRAGGEAREAPRPGSGAIVDPLISAAIQARAEGRPEEAWAALEQYLASHGEAIDRDEAIVLRAQIRRAWGDYDGARADYEEVVGAWRAAGETQRPLLAHEFSVAANALSFMYESEKRPYAALSLHEDVINSPNLFDRFAVKAALGNASRLSAEVGRMDEAVAYADRAKAMQERQPAQFRDDRAIGLEMGARARLLVKAGRAQQAVDEVKPAWEDVHQRLHEPMLSAGRAYATALEVLGRHSEMVDVKLDMLARIEEMMAQPDRVVRVPGVAPQDLPAEKLSLLSALSSASAYGRPDAEMVAVLELLRYPRTEHDAQVLREQLQKLTDTPSPSK